MLSNVLDHLAGILSSSRDEGGAKLARQKLQESFSYPSLTSLLPWREFDEKSDLFINTRSVGFIMEVAPLAGANQQVVQALDDLLRKKLPRKTPINKAFACSGRTAQNFKIAPAARAPDCAVSYNTQNIHWSQSVLSHPAPFRQDPRRPETRLPPLTSPGRPAGPELQ